MRKIILIIALIMLLAAGCSTAAQDAAARAADDEWGIAFSAENVTPTGLKLVCTQAGGHPSGELSTGSPFVLEYTDGEEWKTVELDEDIAWTMEAWLIPLNETTEWEINWQWLYGELPGGRYRIGKAVNDFRAPGDYDTKMYYAQFDIMD